jgi:site-specific DNA recombinase
MGYDLQDHKLIPNPQETAVVQAIFKAYLEQGCVSQLQHYLKYKGIYSKKRISKTGNTTGGNVFSRGSLYEMLQNRIYRGEITHKEASYPGHQPAIVDQKLWDQVQAQFKANLQAEQTRPRSTHESLLMGLLYDSQGNRFTPSHTNKKGRRYRYYTSQAIIKKSAKNQNGPVRLPAQEIEDLVIAQIKGLLQSPQRLLELLASSESSAEETQRLLEAVASAKAHVENLVAAVIHRVTVYDDRLEIQVSKTGLMKHVLGADASAMETSDTADDIFTLEVGATLKRHGGEVRFQFAPDTQGAKPHPVPSLIHALARSHDWVARIMRGELVNQRTIAKETGFDERYVSRIMPLAFLSPNLTEAILDGTTTSYASIGDWVADIPVDWEKQRAPITIPSLSSHSKQIPIDLVASGCFDRHKIDFSHGSYFS